MSLTYSIKEAAQRLGMSPRWLRGFLFDHPLDKYGVPFYVPLGNRKRFTDRDLERILEANRDGEKEKLLAFRARFKPINNAPKRSHEETMKSLERLLGDRLTKAMAEEKRRRQNKHD
jgi:hypothetical protein